MSTTTAPTPLILCILDGWGNSAKVQNNAIAKANTPFWDTLLKNAAVGELETSGEAVGLPKGQMGNSEVGHMTIGSGRIVLQNLPAIDAAVEQGEFQRHELLQQTIQRLKHKQKTCHILGLVSDGGVHSHINHIIALAKAVAEQGVNVQIHAFLDGRDTPPKSALTYIKALEDAFKASPQLEPYINIASLAGRFYAMDRDKRWDRTESAYKAIALGLTSQERKYVFPSDVIQTSYKQDVTDEFIEPHIHEDYPGMEEGDAVVMANFRADRVRQLLEAFAFDDFEPFNTDLCPSLFGLIGMVPYGNHLQGYVESLFPTPTLDHVLGEELATHHLSQLRIAETEKYAHVTFFLNGGKEDVFDGEKRILIASPDVKTYDLKPEMSANEVTKAIEEAINTESADVIIVNYANTDMVGHCGVEEASIKAVQTIDACLARIVPLATSKGGTVLITADHGNIEQTIDPTTGEPHTAHTTNPVPFIAAGEALKGKTIRQGGGLQDVAPTMLAILQLPKPKEMTGESLVL